jgi:phosphonate transport system substrate-binding protein
MNRKGAIIFVLFSLIALIASFVFTLQTSGINEPIRIGVVSMITPVDTVRYYQEIIDYISDKIGMSVELVYRKTYDEMDRLLEKGSVDAAFICSLPYVEDRRKFGLELLVAPQVKGRAFYKSYIVVHKDSDIRNFDELRNRTFAFTDPKSNSGKLYPVYRLAKSGNIPEDFFKKYIYSYSHNKSVELVAKKVVDAAAVESLIYNYMQQKGSPYVQQTRIIEKSPDFGIPPLVTSWRGPTFLKEKIVEILVTMHGDRKGRKILSEMLIDKFVEVPDSNYDSIREMLSYVSIFEDPEKADSEETGIVYVGVVPRDNPRIAYEKYQPIIDFLSETTPYRFELILDRTDDDTVDALGYGEIDIAFLGPLTYLHARAEFGAISILKSITEKGDSFYRSVIVTKESHPIERLSDLKGSNFAFASLKSTSGNLIPRYLLAENGIHLRELRSYRNFDYHDSVVKWVLKGKYDAGAVRESVAEKYLPLGLKIIATSGPIPTGPVVVARETPYAVVETVKDALLNLQKTDKGKGVLQKVDPELRGGFMETSDSDYMHIRKLINDVPKTCGLGCHPKIEL